MVNIPLNTQTYIYDPNYSPGCLASGCPRPERHGLKTRTSFSGGIGGRIDIPIYKRFGLLAGVDLLLRRTLVTRELDPIVPNSINRTNHLEYRLELPIYALFSWSKFTVGAGLKWVAFEHDRYSWENDESGKYIGHGLRNEIGSRIYQPSIRASYEILEFEKGKLKIFTEIDRRATLSFKSYSWQNGSIDILIGCTYRW